MSHPFTKMFENALKKSTSLDNLVLVEAEKLREKGYSENEIYTVLVKLQKGLIDKEESEIVKEAVEEFGEYLDQTSQLSNNLVIDCQLIFSSLGTGRLGQLKP